MNWIPLIVKKGFLGIVFKIILVRGFEDFGIVGTHVFGENFLGGLFVGVDKMYAFDVPLHGRLYRLAIALDIRTRGGEAVALHFDTEVCDLQKIIETHLSCDGHCGQIEKRRIDFSGNLG